MHICTYESNIEPYVTCSNLTIAFARTRCEIWSKLTIKTPEQRYFTPCSSVFIVNLEQVNASWEDVDGFKIAGRVSIFFCFEGEKGSGNSGKSQDYLVSRPTVNF